MRNSITDKNVLIDSFQKFQSIKIAKKMNAKR